MHAASVTFSVLDASGKQIRRDVVETHGKALVGYLQQLPGNLHLCLEEGEWSQWLYEILSPHVVNGQPVSRDDATPDSRTSGSGLPPAQVGRPLNGAGRPGSVRLRLRDGQRQQAPAADSCAPLKLRTWHRCRRRSRIAVASTSSPASTSGQSWTPLLVVIRIEPRP